MEEDILKVKTKSNECIILLSVDLEDQIILYFDLKLMLLMPLSYSKINVLISPLILPFTLTAVI